MTTNERFEMERALNGAAWASEGEISVDTLVRVGPAYRMGGAYLPDGFEGLYTLVGVDRYQGVTYYLLTRGDIVGQWGGAQAENIYDVHIHASRVSVATPALPELPAVVAA